MAIHYVKPFWKSTLAAVNALLFKRTRLEGIRALQSRSAKANSAEDHG